MSPGGVEREREARLSDSPTPVPCTKTQCAIPCSSRIPLGIFLSLLLTTAFLCFLNLRGTRRVRSQHSGNPQALSVVIPTR
ncbi:rCG47122, isoform CRA_a [Rattus norvegicus]|nr:rCG47122, isoform CRA_a [Rattus norvegicus]EDM11798.1 rCG47122, isoform CRA_a [Rattus norvegicus]